MDRAMKLKPFIILFLILNFIFPIFGQDEKKEEETEEKEEKDIISFIEFPKPDLDFGKLLNDPFFCLNIYNKIDETGAKQKIKDTEKGLSKNSSLQDYYDKIVNLERSLSLLTKAVELNPDDQNLLMKLGDCYLSLNKTAEALHCYNKILKNNKEDFLVYTRLQAASFQADYIRLIYSKPNDKIDNLRFFRDFEYIQTAIDNSTDDLRESLNLQRCIYLLRLLLIKEGIYGPAVNLAKDEGTILEEAEELLKNIHSKGIKKNDISYLLGIVNYLKKDYKQAAAEFSKSLSGNNTDILKYDDMLFINIYFLNNETGAKTIAYDLIKKNNDPKYYMLLAYLEMEKNETLNAEMLCTQALRIRDNYAAAYSGLSVISAVKGNYANADAMIRKSIFHIYDEQSLNRPLYAQLHTQMMINEAVIALFKEENERAKIILQSVISDENNDKALQLYKRYFK
jgi:tetratricopeptide (TPR) repeat protein